MDMILETERLYLRAPEPSDFEALCRILQDEEVMYAFEGAFSDEEVRAWIERQAERYRSRKLGKWAVVLKETGEMIGQCGLTLQSWKEREVLEVGYLFARKCWHRGYATEAAVACKQYAFETMGADEVCSIIRDTNTASRKVAERNGMTLQDSCMREYRGAERLYVRYAVRRNEAEK